MNQEALNKTAVKIAVARLMRAAEREAAAEAQETGELSYFMKRRLEELNVPAIWSVKMGLWF
jgi:hypothetical protein